MAEEYSNVAQIFSEIANRLRSFPVPNSANQTNNINSVTQASPTVVNSSTNSILNESASHVSTSSMVSRTHNELQTLFPHHLPPLLVREMVLTQVQESEEKTINTIAKIARNLV